MNINATKESSILTNHLNIIMIRLTIIENILAITKMLHYSFSPYLCLEIIFTFAS